LEYHDFLDVFDEELAMSTCPPSQPGYNFEINLLPNAKLPPHRLYHLSREESRIIKEWLDGMEEMGMISKCTTHCPMAAPVFFVRKKDGTKRPVIDYRRLNDVTVRDSYPLPHINQIMDQVRGSRYFSKFDMKSGYNQLRIKPGHKWMTAFVTPHGVYQCNVMTFGFMNAPPVFQRFIDDTLYRKPELVQNLVGYLNDANTHNVTMEEHVQTNQAFFLRCREAGITLNPKKCEFHKDRMDFLGVELSADGFEMERVKVETIWEWKPPRTVQGIREFIRFCNFYRRFVWNFAEVARPLHDLTRLGAKWEWGNRQQYAFDTLKEIICLAPVLIHADLEERFRVETDASNYAYGAILSQKGKQDQKNHPVAFFSKSMTPTERNYRISDKEALAIVKALQHWRHWLEGTTILVDILTDHKNLQYFMKPRILNRRQLQWMDLLKHYNYTIGYRPGTQNSAVDALSRRAELMPENPEEETPITMIPLE
jgi:RNase H-like domain found in reverse transcriptase/Reverse transcriptase (RNA-dependent DNA polymerase)